MQYLSIKFEKLCKNCSGSFLGTAKQTLCDNCRPLVKSQHRVNSFKTIIQRVHCKYCNDFICSVEKKQTREIKEIVFNRVCDNCKIKNRMIKSKFMRSNNPMNNDSTVRKAMLTRHGEIKDKAIPLYKRLGFKSHLEYMKSGYNPMKSTATISKLKSTVRRKINDGEIVYKRGACHHNFKGTRSVNKSIRDELKNWRKQVLKHYEYKCAECGVHNNKLHVHHIEPLNLIISKICKELNIDIKGVKSGTNEFNVIKEAVILYHNSNDIGVVLCSDCHDKIDKYYHKQKT